MKRLVAIGLSAAALAGCATAGPENDAPIPADKNRRPINIYPSVLPNMATPTPVGSPFASVPLTTPTVAGPMPVAVFATPAAPAPAPSEAVVPAIEAPAVERPAATEVTPPPPLPVMPATPAPAVSSDAAAEVIQTAPRVLPEPAPSPVYESCE
ncbi:hypothetical protein HTK96_13765 [Brevundimonas vesicularis]|uniref:hypothetical protein n=1 Tax=Brevundimonas vesicularis TaxID=41276 RepID=UPI00157168F1|nr:hypothetical protein [Brevundimonas vesicularis]NSX34440.1 hypothetical protein [Brevundimonas vesicularis]